MEGANEMKLRVGTASGCLGSSRPDRHPAGPGYQPSAMTIGPPIVGASSPARERSPGNTDHTSAHPGPQQQQPWPSLCAGPPGGAGALGGA